MIFSIILAFWVGFIIIFTLWPQKNYIVDNIPLIFCLSAGMGLGVVSCHHFLGLMLFKNNEKIIISELTILIIFSILFLFYFKFHFYSEHIRHKLTGRKHHTASYLFLFCSTSVVILSIIRFVFRCFTRPHGFWDAWAIWNLRAKFLFSSSDQLSTVFSTQASLPHTDYPLLLSCNVARLWNFAGHDSVVSPILIALLYTLMTLFLLLFSLNRFKGLSQGLLAIAFILGVQAFLRRGTDQIADMPIAFYFLSTIVLLYSYYWDTEKHLQYIFLAGMMAAFAAWTKNEGMLFIITVILSRIVLMLSNIRLKIFFKELFAFGLGALPVLLTLFIFKLSYAPPNDLLSGQGLYETFTRLFDFQRYIIIGKSLIKNFFKLQEIYWFIIPFFVLIWGSSSTAISKNGIKNTLYIIIIQLTGYFFVYLTTPHDLTWHLATSVERLLVQLLPSSIFLFFLWLKTPEENIEYLGPLINRLFFIPNKT